MLGWLYRFVIGRFCYCEHRWKTIDQNEVYDGGIRPIGSKYTLQCDKCGDIKYRNNFLMVKKKDGK